MKNRLSIPFAILLALALFCAESIQAQIPDTTTAKSEISGFELVSKRTLRSKTFLNPDSNTITVVINSGYLHYPDENGRLQEIDRRIVLNNDSSAYEVTRGLYKARFGFELTAGAIGFELQDSTYYNARLTGLAYYDTTSRRLVMLDSVQKAQGRINGNKIRYAGAFTGVDVEYAYLDTRLKLDAFLSQQARDNLPDPQRLGINRRHAFLVLVSQYDFPDSLEAFANNTKISTRNPNGRTVVNFRGKAKVDFRPENRDGRQKFHLPEEVAFVSASRQDSAETAQAGEKIWRSFYNSGDDNFVLTGVPYSWLVEQPEGTIALDPTVAMQPDAGEVDDTFIYKANGGNDNHGGLPQLQIGPDRTTYERRGLVKFDLSAIPATAVVTEAKLRLYLFAAWGTASSFTMQTHRMQRSWVEGTGSTWNGGNNSGCDWTYADQPTSTTWNANGMQSGTDYSGTILDSEEIETASTGTWEDWQVTDAVQDWIDAPAATTDWR